MGNICKLLVLILFVSESLCKIDVANLIDSIDYYKGNFEIDKKKKALRMERSVLEKAMRSPASKHSDNIVAHSPIFKLRWSEETSLSPDSSSDSYYSPSDPIGEKSSPKDDLPLLEANKKYGLPKVIEKCVRPGDIALTFDDGVSKVTKDVLDILRRENVKATFFVIGNTLDSPILGEKFAGEVLNQMLKDGHVIASHSYSHPNFDEFWPEGIHHEMNRAKELFIKHIGKSPRFMRPPFGNVTPRTIQALHDLGYFIIRWNVDTNDWMHTDAPEKSYHEFRSKLPDEAKINEIRWQKNGLTELGIRTMINGILDSKIALMHDIHPGITRFLPRLIKHARALGYQLVSMDECLGGIHPYFESQYS